MCFTQTQSPAPKGQQKEGPSEQGETGTGTMLGAHLLW